jgi:hypothetical protein
MANINEKQWKYLVVNMLGLRSAGSASDLKGASYAMDMGHKWTDPLPATWSTLLDGTIDMILGFPDHEKRYLLIVSKSTATSGDYKSTFPKCSHAPEKAHAAVEIGKAKRDDLTAWVVKNLPQG